MCCVIQCQANRTADRVKLTLAESELVRQAPNTHEALTKAETDIESVSAALARAEAERSEKELQLRALTSALAEQAAISSAQQAQLTALRKQNVTLVLYSYYEPNAAHAPGNLDFFLRVGVAPLLNRTTVHFVFILNSECTVPLPLRASNVWVRRRENKGYDFCAWRSALTHVQNITGQPISHYANLVLINASVRGPFLHKPDSWITLYTSMLDSITHLIGTTVNW